MAAICLGNNDLEEKKIMPKKLYYNELPDDYPKELEDLFKFYYEYAEELSNSGLDNNELKGYVESYIASLTEEKLLSFCYLNWLAKNAIPLYYSEYFLINNFTVSENVIPKDAALKLSFKPFRNKDVTEHTSLYYFMQPLYLMDRLLPRIEQMHPDLRLLTNVIGAIWIRGTVIYSESMRCIPEDPNSIDNILFATINVKEAFGNIFPDKSITISTCYYDDGPVGKSGINPLEPGKEYLIPLCSGSVLTRTYQYRGNNTIKKLYYETSSESCLLIGKDDLLINQLDSKTFLTRSVFAKDIFWDKYYLSDLPRHEQIRESNFFKERPYNDFKIRVESRIDLVRKNYEKWGL